MHALVFAPRSEVSSARFWARGGSLRKLGVPYFGVLII